MKRQFTFPEGVYREITEYLETHPEKKCTITQMAKAGGLREKAVPYNWLKKKLKELEAKEWIYAKKVRDPIRNVEYTYYTLVPQCEEKGEIGIPQSILKNEVVYREFLREYYGELSSNYYPLVGNFCKLCKNWEKILRTDKNCPMFLEIYQANVKDDFTEITKEYNLDIEKIGRIKKATNKWGKEGLIPLPLFLEDLTVVLVGFIIHQGAPMVSCQECKEKNKCLEIGQKWVKSFLTEFVDETPDIVLKKFWESMLSGVPELHVEFLSKYFSSRYPLDKFDNCFVFLKHYEGMGLPYLYTKAIPLAISMLVETIIFPTSRTLLQLCEKYGKKLK